MRLLPILCALAACAIARAAWPQDRSELLMQSRQASISLLQQLGGQLRATLADHGPEGSIPVCKSIAPELAGRMSRESGWRIARVSLKTRNPLLGTPDAWEQKALQEFDRRAAAGEKPETLEFGEIVEEPAARYYRYLKAIPVQPLCLTCHGSPDQMSPFIQEQIRAEYPHDRGIGYSEGQVRGAVTVKRPL
jgi:Protein of unknown function (DUF3365)